MEKRYIFSIYLRDLFAFIKTQIINVCVERLIFLFLHVICKKYAVDCRLCIYLLHILNSVLLHLISVNHKDNCNATSKLHKFTQKHILSAELNIVFVFSFSFCH